MYRPVGVDHEPGGHVPHQRRTLSRTAVANHCDWVFESDGGNCFGVELEWPVHRRDDVEARPTDSDMATLEQAVLPGRSRVTFEPGGQIELSTLKAPSLDVALRSVHLDSAALRDHLDACGLVAETLAVDDRRPPRRVLERPRYQAMERFFDACSPVGRWMMCNTASTQVNVSHAAGDTRQRWRALHLIGPALIAAFGNSPGTDASGRHWASLRQAIWWSIDPARTRPMDADLPPAEAWLRFALAADVLFIGDERAQGATGTPVPPGLPFGRWMRDGHPCGWPTIDDLRYHLTTLFPPVRPRCWLEVRMLDALPDRIRDVAVLTVAAACTPEAHCELEQRLPDTAGLWVTAARDGLAHPVLDKAARILLDVASGHVGEVTVDPGYRSLIEDYAAAYTRQGRAPHDDLRDDCQGRARFAPPVAPDW